MDTDKGSLAWYSDEDDRARWHGLFIRVDDYGPDNEKTWWWMIYDGKTGERLDSSMGKPHFLKTRTEARKTSEDAARRIIEARYSLLFAHLYKWDKSYE